MARQPLMPPKRGAAPLRPARATTLTRPTRSPDNGEAMIRQGVARASSRGEPAGFARGGRVVPPGAPKNDEYFNDGGIDQPWIDDEGGGIGDGFRRGGRVGASKSKAPPRRR